MRLKKKTSHCHSAASCTFNTRLCDISDTWLCLEDLVMPEFIHLHQTQLFMSTKRFRACTAGADLFSEWATASMPDLQKSCEHSSTAWTPAEPISAFWPFSLLTFRDPSGTVCKSPKEAPAIKCCSLCSRAQLQLPQVCPGSESSARRGGCSRYPTPCLSFEPSSHRWAPITGDKFPRTSDVCNYGRGCQPFPGSSKVRVLCAVLVFPFPVERKRVYIVLQLL